MTEENRLRESICRLAASMFSRGLTAGSSGNISVRVADGWLMTPTGSSMGSLDPARLSKLDGNGNLVSGDRPTKEAALHLVMYECQAKSEAVVHLHSTHSVAVSCLADTDPYDAIPPLTPYYIMRVGRLPLVPYFAPGDPDLPDAVRPLAGAHHAILLANHGPVVAGTSLSNASAAIEELEASAQLHLLLHGRSVRHLTPAQVADLRNRDD